MPNPKKPTKLKVLEGTTRKDRLNEAEPETTGEPVPPEDLSRAALDHWDQIVPTLLDQGVVGYMDSHSLATLCRLLAMADNALDEKLAGELRRWLNEFGMTPASRSKVNAKPSKRANPFGEMGAKTG